MATLEPGNSSVSLLSSACSDDEPCCLEWEEWQGDMPFWQHAAAGSIAGVVEHILIFPLDTVKTHMQALCPTQRTTTLRIIKCILGKAGPSGFFRGLSAIATGCIPAHAVLFSVYEYSKRALGMRIGEHNPAKAAVCGVMSTLSHDIILTPMDVLKQRMQLGSYQSTYKCFGHTLRREGPSALLRSLPTTLAMNIPFGAALVATNESLKILLQNTQGNCLYVYFLSAGLSAGLAAALTNPLDVVKTRLQTQNLLVENCPSKAYARSCQYRKSNSVLRLFNSAHCTCLAGVRASFPAQSVSPPVSRLVKTDWKPMFSLNRLASYNSLSVCRRNLSMCGREGNVFQQIYKQGGFKSMSSYAASAPPIYQGFWSTARMILKEEGMMGFWKGVVPRVAVMAPSAALCWGSYETAKHFFLKIQ
eukprot:Platyproteum_vivax@DN6597_c0_g1_i1.p1